MPRPNLLIIHTDQQSCWSLGAYGGTLVETPHIDRLASEGAVCTSFFANSAICTPSRGCFLTGRYPHQNGAWANNRPLGRDEVTFAEVLRRDGYATSYAGKWHLDGDPRPGWMRRERGMGFNDTRYMFNRGHWQKIESSGASDTDPVVHPYDVIGDETTYPTDWLTARTIETIEASESPFCHMLSIPDPHNPFTVRPPYDTLFRPEDMPLPETLFEENLPDWAEQVRSHGDYFTTDRAQRESTLREQKAQYCGMVKLIDDCVGRILTALEQQGILEETVIVFTSDHGEYMGEHGLMYKNNLYETAYRVPLIVRWPEAIPAGTRIDRVIALVDFHASLLSLMGAAPSDRTAGRNGSALLRGEASEWTDEAFIHHPSFERIGIFTDHYELAYVKDHDPILFDRRNDPTQVDNRFGDPAMRPVVEELTARIVDHNVAVGSPAGAWCRELGRA